MNYPLIRRAIALALALVFALTLSVSLLAPARAAGETQTGVPLNDDVNEEDETEEGEGKEEEKKEEEEEEEDGDDDNTDDDDDKTDEKDNGEGEGEGGGSDNTGGGTPEPTEPPETVPVTGVKLSETSLTLTERDEETLTATVEPANATNKKVTWASDNTGVATVDENGKVTAVKEGTANITVTTEDGNHAATCKVTVEPPTPVLSISGSRNTTMDPGTLTLTATLTNPPTGAKIEWSVVRETGQTITKLPEDPEEPKVTRDDENSTLTSTVEYKFTGAGDFIIMAQCGDLIATKNVTISGVVLSGDKLDPETDVLTMYVSGSATLTATPYGDADDRSADVYWESEDSIVVSVMPDNGSLNAWTVGETVVRVIWGKYTADCEVHVLEDTSVIADADLDGHTFTASPGEPLNFLSSGLYEKLKKITEDKTDDLGAKSALNYITNLKVSPDQGTLYYNYSTESDTGDGVGYTDQFAETAKGAILSAGRLYFVPAQGFSGTAEITFNAVSGSKNFAGAIRIEVGTGAGSSSGSGGETYHISYGARAGEAVWFLADDFNAYCQSVSGRSFNYIVFNLPKSSEGILYYNYIAGSGNPVTTTLQFTQNGRYTIDDVCFVPNVAFEGQVTINFHAVDTSGAAYNGTVTVTVTTVHPSDDSSSVMISGERGRPVTLLSSAFHDACQATLNDTLSFVTFQLPDPSVGTLYYNYRSDGTFDSRVTADTRYSFSGVPGLSSVSFVPASNAAGRVAISYTGYGAGGASYHGTLYITLEEVDRSTIYYSVAKGGSVTFSTSDFNNASQHTAGSNVSYVIFRTMSDTGMGTLYYNVSTRVTMPATATSTTYRYYRSPTGTQKGLSRVFFRAGDTAGAVTITYDAYNSSNQKLFTGRVVIQVGTLTPEDVSLSCTTGGQAGLSAATLNSVCGAVMSGNLSYIEITSVPTAEKGHLYFNYSGFGTGTAVEVGDRFYRVGSPGIDQLNFIPFARFTGEAEITYIGYSADGQEQVSGRIVVNVTGSTSSLYFNDMGDYTWAIDSVDYLRRNGTVNGISIGYYGPGGTVKRGDFVLMLVRAYHLTANGSASFNDVPGDSYYADAIRIATLLGIVNGYNGYFSPEDALTRQDAMLMLYKTLEISGKTTTNGLVADLTGYYDAGEIDSYAREAVGSLVQMGVVKGNGGGYLWPKSQLSRAEAAILLHTIMTL